MCEVGLFCDVDADDERDRKQDEVDVLIPSCLRWQCLHFVLKAAETCWSLLPRSMLGEKLFGSTSLSLE